MDPDQALANARKSVKEINNADYPNDFTAAGIKLAEAFEALDEWISKGGFLPSNWQNNNPNTKE